ncbi:MAG: hypothetical protein ACRBFS_23930 [Aureispira sp.]
MFRVLLLSFLFFLPIVLLAQSLGEHPYGQYHLGWGAQRSQLFGERSVGKFLLFNNVPKNWIKEYQRVYPLEGIQGEFGAWQIEPQQLSDQSADFQFQGSALGELDLSLQGKVDFKKVIGQLQLNGHWGQQRNDHNADGFLDVPLKKRFVLHNQWSIYLKKFTSFNYVQFLALETQGGAMNFEKWRDFLTRRAYGTGRSVTHLVGESDNYITTNDDNMLVINLRVSDHTQNDYYGIRQYLGKEWTVRSYATYKYRLEEDAGLFIFGLKYNSNTIRERLDSLVLERQEVFGGGYIGYENYLSERVELSTRLNVGFHNIAQWLVLPQAQLRVILSDQWDLALISGSGIRYANVLNEQVPLLASSRSVVLRETLLGERAWYYGLSANYYQWLGTKQGIAVDLTAQFYHRVFQNKVVTDLETNPYEIAFYNTNQANEWSVGVDGKIAFATWQLHVDLAYRLDLFYSRINNEYQQEFLYAPHNLMLGVNFPIYIKGYQLFKLQSQFYLQAGQRLPSVRTKTMAAGTPAYPIYPEAVTRWDWRLSLGEGAWLNRVLNLERLTLFVGMDNTLNIVQPLGAVGADEPFGRQFDAGLFWNSTVGRRYYGGLAYLF